MLHITSQLFLYCLLAIDYAAEFHNGMSPVSRPLCSTPAFCHSLVVRDTIQRAITDLFRARARDHGQGASPEPVESKEMLASAGLVGGPTCSGCFLHSAPLCYLLLRIQR
jgi:hypothetical protein